MSRLYFKIFILFTYQYAIVLYRTMVLVSNSLFIVINANYSSQLQFLVSVQTNNIPVMEN